MSEKVQPISRTDSRMGVLLRQRREEMRLTIGEIERATETLGSRISRARISLLERGMASLRADEVALVARAYRFSSVRPLLSIAGKLEDIDRLIAEGQAAISATAFRESADRFEHAAMLAEGLDLDRWATAAWCAAIAHLKNDQHVLALKTAEEALARLTEESETRICIAAMYAAVNALLRRPGIAADYMGHVEARLKTLPAFKRAYCLTNIALAHRRMGQLESVIEAGLQAAALYREIQAPNEHARVLSGVVLTLTGLRRIAEAEELLEEIPDTRQTGTSALRCVARAYLSLFTGKLSEAEHNARLSIEGGMATTDHPLISFCYGILAEVARAYGRPAAEKAHRARAAKYAIPDISEAYDFLPFPERPEGQSRSTDDES